MGYKLDTALEVTKRIVKPRISKVTIPITYECNQRCRTCGIWATYKKDTTKKSMEITYSEFIKFVSKNRLTWVAFTGGEPFLRFDMGLILSGALEYCKVVSITTNGFNPHKISQDVENALSRNFKSILALNVSMNGSKEIHDEISGIPGSFDSARKTIDVLKRLNNPRLSVGVSYTSSVYNMGEFEAYLEEMSEIGICTSDITYGMGQDSPSYYQGNRKDSIVSPGEVYIKEFSSKVLKDLKIGSDPLKLVSKLYLEGFDKGFQNGRAPKCVAGQYSLMLDPYWNVYPCMFFCPSTPSGNLREVDFDISELNLLPARDIAHRCKGCWTPCESYSTIIFRPWRCI